MAPEPAPACSYFLPKTLVVTVAELFELFGSNTLLVTVAVLLRVLPPAAATLTTTVMVHVLPLAREVRKHVTVPVAPTAGLTQLPGPAE